MGKGEEKIYQKQKGKKCYAENCDNVSYAKGLCRLCYFRNWKKEKKEAE